MNEEHHVENPNQTKRMAATEQISSTARRPIPALRWWIGGILFVSTVINYIDRQTLSVLAPFLKQDYHWSNVDYANIVIAVLVADSLGQGLCGRVIGPVGAPRGPTSELS